MKHISDFHYDSKWDFMYLWDFCIKSWTKVTLTKPCKLGLSKRVIPEWTEVVFLWEEEDWEKGRKKVIIEIRWEKIEISCNILMDSELFREMVKVSSWNYKISKVSDIIASEVKQSLIKTTEKYNDKKHDKSHWEKKWVEIKKKEKWRLKRFFEKLWF